MENMNEVKERLVDGDVHTQYAPCRYCGQLYITHGTVEYSDAELEKIGTGQCKCPDAIGERKKVRRRAEAKKIVAQWMPEDCAAQGFIMSLVDQILLGDTMVVNITVKYANDTTITVKETSKSNIRLTMKRGRKVEHEV